MASRVVTVNFTGKVVMSTKESGNKTSCMEKVSKSKMER